MTTEEKLAKAVEFIKHIEKLDKRQYCTFDLQDINASASAYCAECEGQADVELHWPADIRLNTEYIDWKVIDDLSERAWHVLADISK